MNVQNYQPVSSVSMMRHVLQLTIICMMMVAVVFGSIPLETEKDSVPTINRGKRNVARNQVPAGNEQLMNILEEYDTNSVDVNLLRYTPTTPSPEDVNCYVEVPVTRRVGGRCVLLGSSTWGCQAGIFLAFSSECQSEATNQPSTHLAVDDSSQGVTPGANRQRNPNPFRRRRRPNQR